MVPRRIVPKLRHFHWSLKMHNQQNLRNLGTILRGTDHTVSATAPSPPGLTLGSGHLHDSCGCAAGWFPREKKAPVWILDHPCTESCLSRLHKYRVVSRRTIIETGEWRLNTMLKTNSIWLSGTAPLTSCTFGS